MLSFVIELALNVIFEAIAEAAIPNRRPQRFSEGQSNASLGAVAAFAGLMSFIFSTLMLPIALLGGPYTGAEYGGLVVASLAVGAVGYGGRRAALRAPQVTARNLRLARIGSFFGSISVAIALTAAVTFGVRWLLGYT